MAFLDLSIFLVAADLRRVGGGSRLAKPSPGDARRATSRPRPGAGQSIGEEDGSVQQHRLRG